MKIPRFYTPQARLLWRLLTESKRENRRLKRELLEWQNKVLQVKGVTPLFAAPSQAISAPAPPIGPTAKREYLATNRREQILADAEKARNGK